MPNPYGTHYPGLFIDPDDPDNPLNDLGPNSFYHNNWSHPDDSAFFQWPDHVPNNTINFNQGNQTPSLAIQGSYGSGNGPGNIAFNNSGQAFGGYSGPQGSIYGIDPNTGNPIYNANAVPSSGGGGGYSGGGGFGSGIGSGYAGGAQGFGFGGGYAPPGGGGNITHAMIPQQTY